MERNHKIGIWLIIILLILAVLLGYLVSNGELSMRQERETSPATQTATGTHHSEKTKNSTTSSSSSAQDGPKTLERSTTTYHIKIEYPDGEAPGAKAVASYIQTDANNFAARAEEENTMPGIRYEKITEYEKFEHDGNISYFVKTYEYTGGANGTSVAIAFVFNKNGSQLSLEDVVGANPNEQEVFLSRVKKALRAKPVRSGIFVDQVDALRVNDVRNFYLTDAGIVVVFSEYDVAPGAAGIVSVTIPYNTED